MIYYSTIGVYGDHAGAWVDETSATRTRTARGLARLDDEARWTAAARERGAEADILRLAGIYGPGRNALVSLRRGEARRIVKPGQLFNRAHVDDIAQASRLVLTCGLPGQIWNVADDEPAPPQDVVAYAAALLGLEPPPEEPFDEARLSPMAQEFYADNKRVSIAKAKALLGFEPAYPTYREGLRTTGGGRRGARLKLEGTRLQCELCLRAKRYAFSGENTPFGAKTPPKTAKTGSLRSRFPSARRAI